MGLPPSEFVPAVLLEGRETGAVVEDLRLLQEQNGYIPQSQLEAIARRRGVHIRDVHAIASYYPHFRLKPLARADVRVCDDMVCHQFGSQKLRMDLERRFAGHPEVLVRDISCIGRCDRPCAVSINENVYEGANLASASSMVLDVLGGSDEISEPVPVSFAARNPALRADVTGAQSSRYQTLLRLAADKDFERVLAIISESGLRGMGGAGFPAYDKWQAVRAAQSTEKFVICNADESEPGTIKDRYVLLNLPHLVLEGTIICGLTNGAQRGYIYVRREYRAQVEALRAELGRLYAAGMCGRNILGSGLDFELEIFVSPGGYICGEVTALMEAIQGHRAEPRNKPPRAVEHGLWGKPTVINNVETLALAASILAHGAEWYKAQGRNGIEGIKFVSVTGRVQRPGAFEVPMGISYRELIFDYAGGPLAGEEVTGFAPSGPSSGFLPASFLDTPLNWDSLTKVGSMLGSGGVVVCTDRVCMLDIAFNAVRFFRNESCGKCAPCRLGTQKMVEMLQGWMGGSTAAGDQTLLAELSHAMTQTSLCGLGQFAPVPIQSVIRHFPDIVDEHLHRKRCRAGVCFGHGRST